MSFILKRKVTTAVICGSSAGAANRRAALIWPPPTSPLDFSQEHIFHFAEKDGRYYPAIDDTLLDTDVTEIIQLYENDPALQPMVTPFELRCRQLYYPEVCRGRAYGYRWLEC